MIKFRNIILHKLHAPPQCCSATIGQRCIGKHELKRGHSRLKIPCIARQIQRKKFGPQGAPVLLNFFRYETKQIGVCARAVLELSSEIPLSMFSVLFFDGLYQFFRFPFASNLSFMWIKIVRGLFFFAAALFGSNPPPCYCSTFLTSLLVFLLYLYQVQPAFAS